MNKNVAKAVRAGYERHPYPTVTSETSLERPSRLPSMAWITTVAHPARAVPQRILVAGCGTGLEAFGLRRKFPDAEIVAVDFAARPLRIAQRVQKRSSRRRPIRFLQADLTSTRFARLVGREFDLISCHGVMSYLPDPSRALRNLAGSLTPTGILYLGVNGQTHFSANWREFLPAFGFDMARWPGGRRLWQHLKFTARLAGDEKARILKPGPSYLGSDLFAPLIHNLSLAEWDAFCRAAGLHLRGSDGLQRMLWPVINDDSFALFLPRSRAEVAKVLELLSPGAFHRLIFSRQPEVVPPWNDLRALKNWRPQRTAQFKKFKWTERKDSRLLLTYGAANISLELRDADWEIALLRASDGKRSSREILAPLAPIAPGAVRPQLYLFYLLDLINFLPPHRGGQREKLS